MLCARKRVLPLPLLGQMQPGPWADSEDQVGDLGGMQARFRLSLTAQLGTLVLTVGGGPVGGFLSEELRGLYSTCHCSQILRWLSQARVPEGSRLPARASEQTQKCVEAGRPPFLLALISSLLSFNLAGATSSIIG